MKTTLRFIMVITGIVLLTACAHKVDEKRFQSFWKEEKQCVTVAAFKAPAPQLHRLGEQGLLEFAIHSAMSKDMNRMLKTTDLSAYHGIDQHFAKRLKEHKMQAEVYPNRFENTKKNRDLLLKQASGNKVLTLELRAVGARRNYVGLIPMGAPEGYCVLVGQLIDPKDNTLLWSHEAAINQPIQGPWDQGPHYPNLSKATQVALQDATQEVLDSFFSGR